MIQRKYLRGVTLVELLVGMSILGFLLALAMPSFASWMQNMQIRNAAESIQNGLQQARIEAVRRNTTVRFQLTTTVDNSCAISTGKANWVVNLGSQTTNDPSGSCGAAIAATVSQYVAANAPFILQKDSASKSPNVAVASNGTAANWLVVFGSMGQVVWPTAASTQWDLTNSAGGVCAASSGPMTCMRILVSSNGRIRMCNPNLASGTPQGC
ncbi:prepilin-type N-terminal cleavage/methylation domain-containing protein [Collimonas pratensis]|uniref:GspH/FimT family pseudopilin n=1 Tax=Collimonas pratensis TaxID=279113 RepID=UPI00143DA249|nr:GspH/FimT family pseudopilin [Collimonas pratensis]NKI72655.1 prepilin-type N-terminal cleavage/methylation domain-containing protein [Collimonas pratensis]